MTQNILIVDDNPAIVDLYRVMLEMEGYLVRGVYSGKECLAHLERERPDLILLDIIMAPLDGWATLEQIRQNPGNTRIRVIMVTGKEPTHEEAEKYAPLIDGYIMKPVGRYDLADSVRKVFAGVDRLRETRKEAREKGIKNDFIEEYCRLTRIVNAQEAFRVLLEPFAKEQGNREITLEEGRLSTLRQIIQRTAGSDFMTE